MCPFDIHALDDFYARVSAEAGVSVAELQEELTSLFGRPRSAEDVNAYRLSKGPWKKLADEIIPLSRFLTAFELQTGRIRFPLNDHPPDAWLRLNDEAADTGVEVTVAQGTERHHTTTEMLKTGIGRGFLGLLDDAPPAEFVRALARPRVAYTSDKALAVIKEGIRRCLLRKNKPKFADFILLVQAPLITLPCDRWTAIEGDLRTSAEPLPFREAYVVSNANDKPWGFRIK